MVYISIKEKWSKQHFPNAVSQLGEMYFPGIKKKKGNGRPIWVQES